MQEPIFIIVDLFCGFGGTTTGFVDAVIDGQKVAKVIACVNHDPKAIKSHWLNHKDVKHFEEDIRTLDLTELIALVKHYRDLYPNAYLILWASLECTNFSKAKGGQPRNADSRTLADHLERYIVSLNPDYVKIENVVEFMSWGPLDEKGKPLSRKNGQDFMRWRKEICELGYVDEWKELNSADFGAYTSRNRLFGCFAKNGLPIIFPHATHSKKPSVNSMYGDLKKWKAVKDVLDFSDEGKSIFNRDKALSEKTLERIYAGLVKYVAKGDLSFISKYYSGSPASKNISTEGPAGTVTTIDSQALVQPICLLKYDSTDNTGKHYPPSLDNPAPVIITQSRLGLIQGEFLMQTYAADSKGHNTFPVDKPARTITTRDATALVQPEFLAAYYSQGGQLSSIEDPSPTIPTKDRLSLIKPEYFIDKHFGTAQNQSIHQPAGSILPTDKHRLIEAEPFIMPTDFNNQATSIEDPLNTITASKRFHYLVNPSHGGHSTSIDAPCPVIIARQDKAPLYFVEAESGQVSIAIYEGESEMTIKIKQFMAAFNLVDIKMRMLRVLELLKIQGFPSTYQMVGNQSDQKKFIGNSVHPLVPKAWAEALGAKLIDYIKRKAA